MIELDAAAKLAHQELGHALDALGDGSGHDEWGPGPVGWTLWQRSAYAASALDLSTQVAVKLVAEVEPATMIPVMRKLAPIFLNLLLERDAAAGVKLELPF